MTSYEMLLDEAYRLGLIVKEIDLITRKGRCVGNRIAIDKKIKTNHEKACILKEEIAHYLKTVGDISNQSDLNNRKQELIARKFTYQKFVSPEKIINGILAGASDTHDLSDLLQVPHNFLIESIEYYKNKYGIYYVGQTHLLTFEPLNIIKY